MLVEVFTIHFFPHDLLYFFVIFTLMFKVEFFDDVLCHKKDVFPLFVLEVGLVVGDEFCERDPSVGFLLVL